MILNKLRYQVNVLVILIMHYIDTTINKSGTDPLSKV